MKELLNRLETALDQALAARVAEGFKLTGETFFYPEVKSCCVLGAYANDPRPCYRDIAERLNVSIHKLYCIEAGFANWRTNSILDYDTASDSHFYELGVKLREKYQDHFENES